MRNFNVANLSQKEDEEYLRSSASRYYYSVFRINQRISYRNKEIES
ncbi:MAG: hypothetical protein IJI98_11510 [Methanosphaera sp.]|nr:hypothetical protein [Methanosphaera sp.]